MRINKKGSAKIWVIVCLVILLIPSLISGILASIYHEELVDYIRDNTQETYISIDSMNTGEINNG